MSVTRIEQKFAQLKQEGRSALVTYTMAGDPDYQTALNILKGLPEAGADIIELGLPFSDPMADGPAIQAASIRALGQDMTIVKCLDMVREFRKSDSDTPISLMGYYNPIYIYCVDKFLSDALAAGADGLIIVDLPPEEDQELAIPCRKAGMACIHLATPTTDDKRLGQILENASGFLYYVSIAGITGTREPDLKPVEQAISMIRQQTDLPVAVGFGIKTPEMAGKFAKISDAVVVGSAIVNIIKENLHNRGDNSQENLANSELVSRVLDFVNSLAKAVRAAKG